MKISLALGPRRPLSRQTAWGCFTTNAALPGFGSLLAGRISGYPQAALMLIGLAGTLVFGGQFIVWMIGHMSAMQNPDADPLVGLEQMWMMLRWPGLAILVFIGAWLWAFATSMAILREAKTHDPRVPPKLA